MTVPSGTCRSSQPQNVLSTWWHLLREEHSRCESGEGYLCLLRIDALGGRASLGQPRTMRRRRLKSLPKSSSE